MEQREIWCQLAIILVPYSPHSKICCCYCGSYQPSSVLFRFASQPCLTGAHSHANRGVVIHHLWRSPDVGKHATFCLPLNTRALEDQKERTKRKRKGKKAAEATEPRKVKRKEYSFLFPLKHPPHTHTFSSDWAPQKNPRNCLPFGGHCLYAT